MPVTSTFCFLCGAPIDESLHLPEWMGHYRAGKYLELGASSAIRSYRFLLCIRFLKTRPRLASLVSENENHSTTSSPSTEPSKSTYLRLLSAIAGFRFTHRRGRLARSGLQTRPSSRWLYGDSRCGTNAGIFYEPQTAKSKPRKVSRPFSTCADRSQ